MEPSIHEEGGFWYVNEMVGGCYDRSRDGGDIGQSASQRVTRFQTYGEASYYVTIQSLRREMELSRETLDSIVQSIKGLVTVTGRVRTKKVKVLVEWAERFSKQVEPK